MNNNNSKLFNIVEKIKSKYSNDLLGYYYVAPDDRSYLHKGHYIKYIDIDDKDHKIKSGIIVSLSLDKLTLKSIGSNLFWKIKVNKNHIFFYEQSDTRFFINETINDLKTKKTVKSKSKTIHIDKTVNIDDNK